MTRKNRQRQESIIFSVDIIDLLHDGRGLGKHEGKAVFVSGALPGERVQVKTVARRKQHDEALTLAVITASTARVNPKCAHFGTCGGCVLQHLDPDAQILAKQKTLADNLQRIGQVNPESILPALMGNPWGYRRRGRLSVRHVEKKNRTLVGFRETNGKYVADIQACAVLHPAIGMQLQQISGLVSSLDARATLPQIEVVVADETTALVIRHLHPLSSDDKNRLLIFAKAENIAVLLQPSGNTSVHPLWPAIPELFYDLRKYGIRFNFHPLDFIQINGAMNERLVDHAIALLDPKPDEAILDLFCGLGNFTLPLATMAKSVTGVEGDAGLVERARINAVSNNIDNAQFYSADLSIDQSNTLWATQHYDKILLDPARAGADQVLKWLPTQKVQRIVYVSCHPGTLARDAGFLVREHGYRMRAAGVVDMFPHTGHVESIAVFER